MTLDPFGWGVPGVALWYVGWFLVGIGYGAWRSSR